MNRIKPPGRLTLLAIDDLSLPLRNNLCLYLAQPAVRPEPVLVPSGENPAAPDQVAAHFYGTVLHDAGRFRMWYYACHWGDRPHPDPLAANLVEGPVGYAESDDGIHWVKPSLGQVRLQGRNDNNAIALPGPMTEGAFVIKEPDDPDPARRYKMVYEVTPGATIRTATSPDGLRWNPGPELPIGPKLLEPGSFYKFDGLYIVNAQGLGRSEGGHGQGRTGNVHVSPDFERWTREAGESFALAEPADPQARGGDKPYDQAHLGVGATSFGNVLVGLYCIWHNKPYPTEKDWFGLGTTSGDFGLVVSNDGLHFREPVKGHVFLHRRDSPVTPRPAGVVYETVLCQANGILNVGDETRIYHGRWANTANIRDYYAEIALATLPRDRWGALGLYPDAAEGSVWTAPVRVPAGATLRLNADGVAGIRVEVADVRFVPIPARSGSKAGRVEGGDGLDCAVAWPRGSAVARANQTVRFRLTLTKTAQANPRLFAAYLDA